MNGKFILENQLGQTARVLMWESDSATLVLRQDTGRMEAHSDLKKLDEMEVPYIIIEKLSANEIKKAPLKLKSGGAVKFVAEVKNLSPTVVTAEHEDENKKPLPLIFKWTYGVGIGALLLLLGLAHFFAPQKEQVEQQVVTITPRLKTPVEVTKPAKIKKVTPPTVAQKEKKVKVKSPVAQVRKVRKLVSQPKPISVSQMGDLATLGSLNQSRNHGGLKLDQVHVSAGPGLGGKGGSGGMQTTSYARGLIAAPLGPQARATGSGGYGKSGPGGGQAGAGKLSLIGSSTAYFQPVVSDTVLEGGLDSAQIAEVIQRHLGEIRSCYEKGLQTQPDLNGRVAIRFLINGQGLVTTAQVTTSSLRSQNVESCLVGRLKAWPFPKPKGGVVVKVNYPFVLKRMSQG